MSAPEKQQKQKSKRDALVSEMTIPQLEQLVESLIPADPPETLSVSDLETAMQQVLTRTFGDKYDTISVIEHTRSIAGSLDSIATSLETLAEASKQASKKSRKNY